MRGRRPVKCGKSALQIFSSRVVRATPVVRAFQTPLNEFSGIDRLFYSRAFTKHSPPSP